MKLVSLLLFCIFFSFSSCFQDIETIGNGPGLQNCSPMPNNVSGNIALFNSLALSQPDSLSFHCLLKVTNNFYKLEAYDHFYKSSLTTLKWTKNYNNIYTGKSNYYLAVYFDRINNYDSSFYYLLRAESNFKQRGAYLELARVYNAEARILIYYNDNLAAENYAIKALQYSIRADDKYEIFTAYALLGISASALENYTDAMNYHTKALEIVRKFEIDDDFENECVILNNIGNVYQEQEDFSRAIEYYRVALSHNKIATISPEVYARLLGNYGHTLLQINNKNSYAYLSQSLSIYDSIKSPDIVDTQLFLSDYFIKMKDSSKALLLAEEALIGAKKYDSPHDYIRALNQLSSLDAKNANNHLRELIGVSDSLNLAERLARNKFARLRFETDELATQKKRADKQKGLAISIAAIIILLVILVLITQLHRVKEKELKFEQNQRLANEEIYSLILDQQSKIDEGREKEKKRISEDLHDGVLNKLASTRLNLFILNFNTDEHTIKKCLSFISGIQDIEKEIRGIAHDLNNSISTHNTNYLFLLEELVSEQKSISNAFWDVEIDKFIDWDILNISVKVHLYRILQEIFQNTNKHSRATEIYFRIQNQKFNIKICVIDNGIGFRFEDSKNGIGLRNIDSRIKSVHGRVEISSRPFGGTKIELYIPI